MLRIKENRTDKGHWYGYFQGANKSVVVEGSLAKTADEAAEYVATHPFTSEGESEREITNKDTGEVTKIKGTTYFYGEFGQEGYKSFTVNKLKGKKTVTVEVEYVD